MFYFGHTARPPPKVFAPTAHFAWFLRGRPNKESGSPSGLSRGPRPPSPERGSRTSPDPSLLPIRFLLPTAPWSSPHRGPRETAWLAPFPVDPVHMASAQFLYFWLYSSPWGIGPQGNGAPSLLITLITNWPPSASHQKYTQGSGVPFFSRSPNISICPFLPCSRPLARTSHSTPENFPWEGGIYQKSNVFK